MAAEESAAETTISSQTGPSPAERKVPTPAPSSTRPSAPTMALAAVAAASLPSAPQQPPAAPPEPVEQAAAPPAPSTTAPAATGSAPSAAALPAAAGHQQNGSAKKRKPEKWELPNYAYFKIRAVIRDLRPAFLEVLHAPEFQTCKAADDVRRQMKVILDLSKQLRDEGVSSVKKTIEVQPFEDRKEAMENRIKVERQVEADAVTDLPNQPGKSPSAPEEVISEAKGLEKQLQGHQGTYVVGGSPMGWNFLVYRGSEPVYYGVTKEAARLRRSSIPSSEN